MEPVTSPSPKRRKATRQQSRGGVRGGGNVRDGFKVLPRDLTPPPTPPRRGEGGRKWQQSSELLALAFCTALLPLKYSPPLHAEPLKLEPGKSIEITCDTRAVVVATDAAAATAGAIRLKLDVAAGEKAEKGTWSVVSADDAHKGSLAQRHKETCAKGCPFDLSGKGEFQLWAPEPKTIDKLGDKDTLTVAVIKPDNSEIRASTFVGREIEALESGACKTDESR